MGGSRGRRARRAAVAVAVSSGLAVASIATSCGRAPAGGRPHSGTAATITVSAASSLTEAFTDLGPSFERTHPGAEVSFTFASSSTLARQIEQGAPADVFASADRPNMARLATAGLVEGRPTVFAANRLAIVTRADNPQRIGDLADLADAGVVALCAEEVPCGRFAFEALTRAEVTIPESRVTRGQDVKATLSAVTQGDAVAGIVYASDAQAAGSAVATVPIAAADNAVASYPAAVVDGTRHPETARAFVAYLTSRGAQRVLRQHGFAPPGRR